MGAGASVLEYDTLNYISLENALELAEPFDLIIFHSQTNLGKILSLNEFLGSGHTGIGHVAMVITSDVIPIRNSIPGRKYTWEGFDSTKDNPKVLDIETGIPHNKVHIRDLEAVISDNLWGSYRGTLVGLAKLKKNPWKASENRPDYRNLLKDVCNQLKEKFADIPFDMLKSGIELTTKRIISDQLEYKDEREFIAEGLFTPALPLHFPSHLLCVTAVVLIWQTIGVLPNTIDPLKIYPTDFFPTRNNNQQEEGSENYPALAYPLDVLHVPVMIDAETAREEIQRVERVDTIASSEEGIPTSNLYHHHRDDSDDCVDYLPSIKVNPKNLPLGEDDEEEFLDVLPKDDNISANFKK